MNTWPKKLKRLLMQMLFLAGGFGLFQWAMENVQQAIHFSGYWKFQFAAWTIFLAVMAWKTWQLYVGVYRDGTFFYDDD